MQPSHGVLLCYLQPSMNNKGKGNKEKWTYPLNHFLNPSWNELLAMKMHGFLLDQPPK